jgi:hypothetical protein
MFAQEGGRHPKGAVVRRLLDHLETFVTVLQEEPLAATA